MIIQFLSHRPKRSHSLSRNCVTFAAGTKTHDGLSPSSLLLQDLIIRGIEDTFSEHALVQFLKTMPQRAHLFPSLIPRLHQLVVQLGSAPRRYVYVIPVNKGLALPVSALGPLMTLYRLCVNTFRRVREVYIKRMQKSSANDLIYESSGGKAGKHMQYCLQCTANSNNLESKQIADM